jgi:chemotaxis protein MotA
VDKISLAGLAIGAIAILGGQLLEGGHIGSLVQPTALLIVLGGTLGAVLLQSPYHVFKRGMHMAKWIWVPPVIDQKRLLDQVMNWSQLSRREGLLSLENHIPQIKDEFTKKGLQLLVDGADPERIRELLEVEIDTFEDEWKQSAKIWDAAGGYSPTIDIGKMERQGGEILSRTNQFYGTHQNERNRRGFPRQEGQGCSHYSAGLLQ